MKYLNLSSSKHEFIEDLRSREFPQYKNLMLEEYNLFLSEMMMLKVDRTSMANSLEVRSPFVDHTLIEYVFSRNSSYYNPEIPKQILKSYLSKDFDLSFTSRSKQGFIFDLEGWVYSNLALISQTLNEGSIINNIRSNFLNYFSYNKTRINANRIWRAFVLEYYLSNIKIQSLQ
jgi:asparagine synthase (glutamine-hydrolysing)